MLANHTKTPTPKTTAIVHATTHDTPLAITLSADNRTVLEPTCNRAAGTITTLLTILHKAQMNGTWTRMKNCHQYNYTFYDRSKNHSTT